MNTFKLVVIAIIVAAVPIFGLHDCFLRDQFGDRSKIDPNTGLIYHDDPFETGQTVFFGCETHFQGTNGLCILKHSIRQTHGRQNWIEEEILTARLTKGSSYGEASKGYFLKE